MKLLIINNYILYKVYPPLKSEAQILVRNTICAKSISFREF